MMLGIKLNLLVRGLRPTYIIEILYKEDLATSLICICIYACIQWFNLYQYELIYITCIYFILWIRILYYIIYFLAKIIPVLATGDFFRLLAPFCFWHASTFFFFSLSHVLPAGIVKCWRFRMCFPSSRPRISHSPSYSGPFYWRTILNPTKIWIVCVCCY